MKDSHIKRKMEFDKVYEAIKNYNRIAKETKSYDNHTQEFIKSCEKILNGKKTHHTLGGMKKLHNLLVQQMKREKLDLILGKRKRAKVENKKFGELSVFYNLF